MEITCLITAIPIEGESIEIEFNSNDETLLPHVEFALAQVNNRLREINLTILEDMEVKKYLSHAQWGHLNNIISAQFPYTQPEAESFDSSSARVLVRKMTNHKEQIALRFAGPMNGANLQRILLDCLNLTTERVIKTNINDEKAHKLLKSLTSEDQMTLQMILDVLYGRAEQQVVANRLSAYAEDKANANGVQHSDTTLSPDARGYL